MKKFNEYITEEIMPQALTDKEFVGIESESVRDNINSLLSGVTTKSVVTPYISLERVRKALAYYHIFLPAHQFMDGNSGNVIFNISQFGEKYGQTNTGEFVSKKDSPYCLYFEYQMNDLGLFDVFAEIVDDDDLEEIMSDFEDELSDDNGEEDDSEVVSSDQQNSYLLNKDEHKGNVQEDYDQTAKQDAEDSETIGNRAKDPKIRKAWKGAAKKLKKTAVTGMDEAKRVVTATKKAEKGTKWKLISRNPDSEGSDMELRQGKRVKMAGGFYRDSQDFGLLPTKKGKMNMKAKSQYFDMPADIMKTVKEETQLNEIKKIAKRAEAKAAKEYYDAYGAETKAREDLQKKKTPEARAEAEAAKKTRLKAKDRVIKFQQYNDKKKKLEEVLNDPKKKAAYLKAAKLDRDQAIDDRDHYKKNLTDPDRVWTKGIPHKDSQYKMAVDRNKRAMKRKKGIERAEKK